MNYDQWKTTPPPDEEEPVYCDGCGASPRQHCPPSCPAQCFEMPKSTRCKRRMERAQARMDRLHLMITGAAVGHEALESKWYAAQGWRDIWQRAMDHHIEEEFSHEESLFQLRLDDDVSGFDEDDWGPEWDDTEDMATDEEPFS